MLLLLESAQQQHRRGVVAFVNNVVCIVSCVFILK
jgi:hypothetical protein